MSFDLNLLVMYVFPEPATDMFPYALATNRSQDAQWSVDAAYVVVGGRKLTRLHPARNAIFGRHGGDGLGVVELLLGLLLLAPGHCREGECGTSSSRPRRRGRGG